MREQQGFVTSLIVILLNRETNCYQLKRLRPVLTTTLDFYQHADLGLHTSCLFSSRYRVFYKAAGCCRSSCLHPLSPPISFGFKSGRKNVHKPQRVLRDSGKKIL